LPEKELCEKLSSGHGRDLVGEKATESDFSVCDTSEVAVVGINEKGCQAIKTAGLKERTTMQLTSYADGFRK